MADYLTGVLVGFARTLRNAGVQAIGERVEAMIAAVDALDVTRPEDAYWAGRLTLCGEPDDLPIYDAAFAAYFGGRMPVRPPAPVPARRRAAALFAQRSEGGEAGADPQKDLNVAASAAEVLRRRDVAALSAAERDEVRRLVALLAPSTAVRPGRRWRPARGGGVDPPRTVRRMLRHLGEPTRLARRDHRPKPRRLVLLLDVSGSMAPYADALLRFGHAAVRRRPTLTEAFTLGTRLTRVTRALRHRDPDGAIRGPARPSRTGTAAPGWRSR
ncbi:vWA domain-containing protein [Phytohabitans rumicis]|uniref:VWA domain-containing protein n=1 Tax=Phytohabitans rumicis TaxID=1076125 RepID=A0A6V8L092_9ACTN|nr:VWA domain-containing protein [Phytohabitans rumicis]GFJ88171.1 hypothetical protein Prum_018130 [Phytohabitans rumicis]